MGFWAKWLNQVREIDRLEKEVDFSNRQVVELSNLLKREEERNAVLWSAVEKELSDHKKTLRRVADQASKQLGLPQGFLKDEVPSKSAVPPPPADEEEVPESVLWQATVQRSADIEAGISPAPLEHYIAVIQENPNKFILG